MRRNAETIERVAEPFTGLVTPRGTDIRHLVRSQLRWDNRVRISMDALDAIGQRIREMEAIITQNALTTDDLPTAGWGLPPTDTTNS